MNKINWNFENTYFNLSESFKENIDPIPVKKPELVLFNKDLASDLSLNFSDISTRLEDSEQAVAHFTAMSFIITGLLIKSAVFPLHAWLPGSYKYAPALATCFFSAIATKVSLYLLIRILFDVGDFNSLIGRPFIDDIFFLLALVTIFKFCNSFRSSLFFFGENLRNKLSTLGIGLKKSFVTSFKIL